jgi:alpha-ketoglutarate-dependent taurine dioxygenase
MTMTEAMEVRPLTPALGAVINGVDLAQPLAAEHAERIRGAVLEHGVVFFRGQDLSRAQMLAFMDNFGRPCVDPFAAIDQPIPAEQTIIDMATLPNRRATAVWHIDSSLAAEPAALIALRALELPPAGGDTCWASMYAAYDALSQPLRSMLDGLTAEHSAFKVLPLLDGSNSGYLQEEMRNVHPVIRLHPETGKRALFVDELWTERVVELEPDESTYLLAFLFEHIKSPAFSIRWQWQVNDLALWDNRAFQHYAVNDYQAPRVMQKSLLAGDRPCGPHENSSDRRRLKEFSS